MPSLAIEGLTPDVRLLPITEPELTRSVSVAVRAGTASAPRIAVLIAALREAARGLGEHSS
ncbi:hypothetical protein [Saccharopolyspora erythraea]|uniref:hypothetical protein n=1 Tax=Saccharopolyspora erythraea TaxID=1836 RepID=UPI00031B0A72|nr:hypothetical protein [Saccharopolyspora erythraea]